MAHNKFSDWTSEEKEAMLTLKEHMVHKTGRIQDSRNRAVKAAVSDDHDECPSGQYWHRRYHECKDCGDDCKECVSDLKCTACANDNMETFGGRC